MNMRKLASLALTALLAFGGVNAALAVTKGIPASGQDYETLREGFSVVITAGANGTALVQTFDNQNKEQPRVTIASSASQTFGPYNEDIRFIVNALGDAATWVGSSAPVQIGPNGATVPASAALLGSNSSNQLVAVTSIPGSLLPASLTIGKNGSYSPGAPLPTCVGNCDVLVGVGAGSNLNTADFLTTAVGFNALGASTAANSESTAIGWNAQGNITLNSAHNTSVGINSIGQCTTGCYQNATLGTDTLRNIGASGGMYQSVAIGDSAMIGSAAWLGYDNIAIGQGALNGANATTANGNVAIGYATLQAVTSASNEIALGSNAGNGATTNANEIFIGTATGEYAAGSHDNTVIGASSFTSTLIGSSTNYNTIVGEQIGGSFTNGVVATTLIGYQAGYSGAGIYDDAFIGYQAGYSCVSCNADTIIGYNVGHSTITSGSGVILIGSGAQAVDTPLSSTSNYINIENIVKSTGTNTPSTSASTVAGTLAVTGGIVGTPIGATTPSTGAFTTTSNVATLTKSSGSTGQPFGLQQTLTLAGTPNTVPYGFADYISVNDTMDSTNQSGSIGVAGDLAIVHNQNGGKGGRTPLWVELNGGATGETADRNFVAITGVTNATSQGGTSGNNRGLWYSFNGQLVVPSGATFVDTMSNEFDITNASTSLSVKNGFNIVTPETSSNYRGVDGDAAYSVNGGNSIASGAPGWKCLFCTGGFTGFEAVAPSALDTAFMGTITGGSSYTNGTYTAVPLTGGTGNGAQATVVIAGGAVTTVTITNNGGTGYTNGDVISASNTNLGGTGSGFSVPATQTVGTIFSDWANNNHAGLGLASGTVGSILDFHNLTVKNYDLNLPNFSVTGAGALTAASLTTAGTVSANNVTAAAAGNVSLGNVTDGAGFVVVDSGVTTMINSWIAKGNATGAAPSLQCGGPGSDSAPSCLIVTKSTGSILVRPGTDGDFFKIQNAAGSLAYFDVNTSTGYAKAATGLDNTPIGPATPNTGAFTTLSASSTVSGAGFSSYLASPPAIGGTAAAAGTFTSVTLSNIGKASGVAGQSGLPFIYPSSGSIGNNCAITGLTSMTNTYANAYIYLPAGAIATSSTAGWYPFQASSATAGTCFNNIYTGGNPTVPGGLTAFSTTGPGVFTQTTGIAITGPSYTIAGNTLGVNGGIDINSAYFWDNSANAKTVSAFYGASAQLYTASPTTNTGIMFDGHCRQAGATGAQHCYQTQLNAAAAPAFSNSARSTIDSTASQTITIKFNLANASDFIVLEEYTIKINPN